MEGCHGSQQTRCKTLSGVHLTMACTAIKVLLLLYYADPCSSGDIRFLDNTTEYEGHIEICTDHGLWSIISAYSWSYLDAVVACRQLGFTDSSKTCVGVYLIKCSLH